MADNGAGFRARAAELAAKARNINPQSADVAGTYGDAAQVADPMMVESAQRMDDAYARRGLQGPLAAGAAMDATLQNAATKQTAYRSAVTEALKRRRSGISQAYGAAASQEAVAEAQRRLEEEKRRRDAALLGNVLGTVGMVGGYIVGGPAGGMAGGALGKSVGGA